MHSQAKWGVASARQAGADVATGEYVIHADPDDWMEQDMLEQMYNEAIRTNADVVMCDYYETNSYMEDKLIDQRPSSLVPHDVLIEIFGKIHGSLWNKLLRRSCYMRFNLQFVPGVDYCKDVLLWVQLLKHPEVKVAYLHKAFYHYYQGNEGSIIHQISTKALNSIKLFYEKAEAMLPASDKHVVDENIINIYWWLWVIKKCREQNFAASAFLISAYENPICAKGKK